MEKEVLIHVKGLHMMDTPEGDEPIEIVVPGEYIFPGNGSPKKRTGKYTYGF